MEAFIEPRRKEDLELRTKIHTKLVKNINQDL